MLPNKKPLLTSMALSYLLSGSPNVQCVGSNTMNATVYLNLSLNNSKTPSGGISVGFFGGSTTFQHNGCSEIISYSISGLHTTWLKAAPKERTLCNTIVFIFVIFTAVMLGVIIYLTSHSMCRATIAPCHLAAQSPCLASLMVVQQVITCTGSGEMQSQSILGKQIALSSPLQKWVSENWCYTRLRWYCSKWQVLPSMLYRGSTCGGWLPSQS